MPEHQQGCSIMTTYNWSSFALGLVPWSTHVRCLSSKVYMYIFCFHTVNDAVGDSRFATDRLCLLWRCWLGDRKGIWPVRHWVVGCWHGYLSGARCRLAYDQLMPLPLTVSCFSKVQIGFIFLVPTTQVVPDKRVCVCLHRDGMCRPVSIGYSYPCATVMSWQSS